MISRSQVAITALLWRLTLMSPAVAEVQPTLSRVPGGGIQPQVVVDELGTVHLLYFKGDPQGGDLYYSRRPAGASAFEAAKRVNSTSGTAVAIGTIRGGQLALGKNRRLHVVWNGATQADRHPGNSLFYSRLSSDGSTFEPQRDVMTFTGGLDGGASVASDSEGRVYVAWHAITRTGDSEEKRAVFLARSTNEGRTFETEHAINPEPTGACGCCGLKIFSGRDGLYLMYRAARGGSDRRETLLGSFDSGQTFRTLFSHPWTGTTCPMSAAWLANSSDGTIAAWENRGRVWFSRLSGDAQASEPAGPAGSGQKYPVAVVNREGAMLLVWVEGAGWQKGGILAWQQYDRAGKSEATPARTNAVPVWSFAAAWVRADDRFEIIY